MKSLKPVASLKGHADHIDSFAWSPDGRQLASVSRDGSLMIWDIH